MRELLIPLLYHWGALQYFSVLGLWLAGYLFLHIWACLWNRTWSTQKRKCVLCVAIFPALCGGIFLGHATVAEQLVSHENGKALLEDTVIQEPPMSFAYNMYRLIKDRKNVEECKRRSIPTYVATVLLKQHSGGYLPLNTLPDWQSSQDKIAETALLCVHGKVRNGFSISSWTQDADYNSQQLALQNACTTYLAEQQYIQNKEKLQEWAECHWCRIYILVLLPLFFFIARAAYKDIVEVHPL